MQMIGIVVVLGCLALMIGFSVFRKDPAKRKLRDIPAFMHLKQAVGRTVEAGQRIHVTIGHGGIENIQGAPGLAGINLLESVLHTAASTDRPPLVTSGEAIQAILAEDTVRDRESFQEKDGGFVLPAAQLTGLTPFSYAAGALPLMHDEHISTNLLAGSFGSEVALLTDASDRAGGVAIGGSENLDAQAILYASTGDPLVGEELFAAGAYLQGGRMHLASLFTQDVLRWILITVLIVGALLKLAGVI
jgi:hypothetical protein